MLRLIKNLLHLLICFVALWTAPTFSAENVQQCPARIGKLNAQDMDIARTAWEYFENNLQPATGLVNAGNGYPSTTLWDAGSSLAAFVSAEAIGLIPRERFDHVITKMLQTLAHLDLFNNEAPNKAYNTKTAAKVDYGNKPSEAGIGISALDLGRITSWLNILACRHPQHQKMAARVLESWSLCRLLEHGQMYGLEHNDNMEVERFQEGRLGYEQYAGKAFQALGFDQSLASTYQNMYSTSAEVEGVEIRVDARDASTLSAHNYVVAESYAMDYFEHGGDEENMPLIEAIYEAQKRRWQRTGILTAVSEDNIDRKPYFVYNTLFTNGEAWKALTHKGLDMESMKTLSTKAAFSMAYLFPEREYSQLLLEKITQANNPKGGWYSGIYEDPEKGFNKATTANTNGVILSIFLNKLYGAPTKTCEQCGKSLKLSEDYMDLHTNKKRCWAKLPEILAKNKARFEQASTSKIEHSAPKQSVKKPKLSSSLKTKASKDVGQIWSVFGKVKYIEKLKNKGKLKQAATTLDNLKKTIWKLSQDFPSEKGKLRSLMAPIDITVAQWRNEKSSTNTQSIQDTLKAVAQNLQEQ